MIRLILVFILLFAATFAGLHLTQNPGYVLIAFNGWTIETTFWFAIFALVVLFILFHLALFLLHKPSQWIRAFHEYREQAPMRRAQALIRKKEYLALEETLYLSSMKDLENRGQNEKLNTFYRKLPYQFRHNPAIRQEYLQYLIDSNQLSRAEKMIRKALVKNPRDVGLIELYGKCHYNQKQMAFAESLISKQEDASQIYLCLGNLCMHWQLWGKARNYLEKSLSIHATPEAYQTLGKLYESIHDSDNAYANYRNGLYLMNEKSG